MGLHRAGAAPCSGPKFRASEAVAVGRHDINSEAPIMVIMASEKQGLTYSGPQLYYSSLPDLLVLTQVRAKNVPFLQTKIAIIIASRSFLHSEASHKVRTLYQIQSLRHLLECQSCVHVANMAPQ